MLIGKGLFRGNRTGLTGILFFGGLLVGSFIVVLFYPAVVFAGDHGDTGDLEHKVDIENQSGINLIIAKLYNDHRLLFALAVTVTMAVVGIIIGQITGVLLRFLGLK
jgi:hypothetical protein